MNVVNKLSSSGNLSNVVRIISWPSWNNTAVWLSSKSIFDNGYPLFILEGYCKHPLSICAYLSPCWILFLWGGISYSCCSIA